MEGRRVKIEAPLKTYRLTIDLKIPGGQTTPDGWDWCSILNEPLADRIKVVSCQEYPTRKPETQRLGVKGIDSLKTMGEQ